MLKKKLVGSLQHPTPWRLVLSTPGSQHMAGHLGHRSLVSSATLGPRALPQGPVLPRVVSRAERVRMIQILRDKATVY